MNSLFVIALQLALAVVASATNLGAFGTIGTAASLYGERVHLTGGYDGEIEYNHHTKFDLFASLNWTRQPVELENMFKERSLHSSEIYQDYLMVWGRKEGFEIIAIGYNTSEHNTSWSHVDVYGGPSTRVGHSATLYNEEFYLFGGIDLATGEYKNDLWKAEVVGPNITWTKLMENSAIPARAFHSAVIYHDSIYIFGGGSGDNLLNDMWRYDIQLKYWIRIFIKGSRSPPAREAHVAGYYGDEGIYVWGGRGAHGFVQDMWRYDLQLEMWEKVYQGLDIPSPRAHTASVVFEDKLVIFGGKIGDELASDIFWSPYTRYLEIENPDDYSGEVWSFDFTERRWTYSGCLPVFNETEIESCRSFHKPTCPYDCSGNGVCVAENTCVCRGQWEGPWCEFNVCDYDLHRGYPVNLMDRVLVSETILRLGKELAYLRAQLVNIRDRLPSYEEWISCIHSGEQQVNQVYVEAASFQGVLFHNNMTDYLLPIFSEFNEVLATTKNGPNSFDDNLIYP